MTSTNANLSIYLLHAGGLGNEADEVRLDFGADDAQGVGRPRRARPEPRGARVRMDYAPGKGASPRWRPFQGAATRKVTMSGVPPQSGIAHKGNTGGYGRGRCTAPPCAGSLRSLQEFHRAQMARL